MHRTRPVPLCTVSGECFLVRHTPATSKKTSVGVIENMHFIFLKNTESRLASSAGRREEPKPLSTLQPQPPSQKVPTPPSVHHDVQVC